MLVRRLLRGEEPRVQAILERQFSEHAYRVLHKVRAQDVIDKSRGEYLPTELFNYLRASHFDFVISHHHKPIFAVEFDGWHHLRDPATIRRDVMKNRLCHDAKLPLIRITPDYITEYGDKLSLLDYMIGRYRNWPKAMPEIRAMIDEFTASLDPNIEYEPDDLVVDCDPSFWFNVRNPVPSTAKVIERLWNEHRIALDGSSSNRIGEARLLCRVSHIPSAAVGGDSFHTSAKSIVVTGTHGNEAVFRDRVSVSTRSWLPIDTLDWTVEQIGELFGAFYDTGHPNAAEAALRAFEQHARHLWFPDLPGCSPWDIADHFSDFLACRAVERWARHSNRARPK